MEFPSRRIIEPSLDSVAKCSWRVHLLWERVANMIRHRTILNPSRLFVRSFYQVTEKVQILMSCRQHIFCHSSEFRCKEFKKSPCRYLFVRRSCCNQPVVSGRYICCCTCSVGRLCSADGRFSGRPNRSMPTYHKRGDASTSSIELCPELFGSKTDLATNKSRDARLKS